MRAICINFFKGPGFVACGEMDLPVSVGAGLPAMVANDDAGSLTPIDV